MCHLRTHADKPSFHWDKQLARQWGMLKHFLLLWLQIEIIASGKSFPFWNRGPESTSCFIDAHSWGPIHTGRLNVKSADLTVDCESPLESMGRFTLLALRVRFSASDFYAIMQINTGLLSV